MLGQTLHICAPELLFQQEATLSTLFVSCLSLIPPILSPVILGSSAKRSSRRIWRGSRRPCPPTRCAVIVSILLVGALGLQIFQRQALLNLFVSSSIETTENIYSHRGAHHSGSFPMLTGHTHCCSRDP